MITLLILAALGGTALFYKSSKKEEGSAPGPSGSGAVPVLDSDIPSQESQAISNAVRTETVMKNLYDFGGSLLPDFPVAAAFLITRSGYVVRPLKGKLSSAANIQSGMTVKTGAAAAANTKITTGKFDTAAHTRLAHGEFGAFELSDVTDPFVKTAKATVNVLTHPADTASGAWKIVTHPSDSITDFGNGLVDVLHQIPGMDEAGELLKKFAKTEFGEWCLKILATTGYYVMAPYVGAKLAAASFALPGLAQAKPFVESWTKEFIARVIATASILLPGVGAVVGAAASAALDEATNKLLAQNPELQQFIKDATAQVGTALNDLTAKLGPELEKKVKDGVSGALSDAGDKLKKEYGMPPDFNKMGAEFGIRADNAAAGFDLLNQTHYQSTTVWDAATGQDLMAKLRRAKMYNVQVAASKTVAQTKTFKDVRMGKFTAPVDSTRSKQSIERAKWVARYLSV